MFRNFRKFALAAIATMIVCSAGSSAQAGFVTYKLGTTFNGASPTSTAPWLTATFADNGADNVTLTLTSSLNVASEFIDEFVFNVNPSIVPSALTIAQFGSGPVISSIVHTTQNAQDLVGGGAAGKGFDVKVNFTNANNGNRFDGTDVVTISLSHTGLTFADFKFTNTITQGHTTIDGKLPVAAHVQGIPLPGGGTTSGAITVPEPSSLALFGIAGLLAVLRRRRV